ncbi:MAG TPA: CRISPR-associated endonuclease Cas2 [Myxococcota bacterium]|nr:CRISPR-associated endonuclease Cas2 [Myxococcota bacterium]
MRLLLCYDVAHDRRRARIFKKLKAFLRPVQESVFEGELPDRRWGALVELLHDNLDMDQDSVRIYQLCRGCRGLTVLMGVSPRIPTEEEPILI